MGKFKNFLLFIIGVVSVTASFLVIAAEENKDDIDQLLQKIESIKLSDIVQATNLLEQVKPKFDTLSDQQRDHYLLLQSHNYIIRNQFKRGIDSASKIIHQSKNKVTVIRAMSRRAMAYLMTGNYKLALIDTFEALNNIKHIDDSSVINSVLVNATSLHMELALQKKGHQLLLKSLAVAKKNNDDGLYCATAIHLGELEYNYKNYPLALKENTNALDACKNVENNVYSILLKAQRARILGKLDRVKEGIELINSDSIAELSKSWPNMQTNLNLYKAELAYQNKEYQRAIDTAMLAYEVAKKDNSLKMLHDVTRVIILSYKALGDEQKYAQFYEDYQYSGIKVHLGLERQKLLYYQVMNSDERTKQRQQELAKLHVKNALSEMRP